METRGARPEREVRADVEAVLARRYSDPEMREQLEKLAREWAFSGLTAFWGPLLYERNRRYFEPFILAHFSTFAFVKKWRFQPVPWKKHQDVLELWLEKVDQHGDIALFHRLYSWKTRDLCYPKAEAAWREQLRERVHQARNRHQLQLELAKMNFWYCLDQTTALELYQASALTSDFILHHLPRDLNWLFREKRGLWTDLLAAAEKAGDQKLRQALYQQQVPLERWRQDVLRLADTVKDPAELIRRLEEHHPQGWALDLGPTFCDLLEKRGADLFPYLIPKLHRVARGWFKKSFARLKELAEEREWWDFWGGLVRKAATAKEYNKVVRELVEQGQQERLQLLTGVSREWNFSGLSFGHFQQLDDATAVALYERYPKLLRQAFLAQIQLSGWNLYPKLTAKAFANDDEILIDYLASRLINLTGHFEKQKALMAEVDRLAEHYRQLTEEGPTFARRAASVLGQVPPYTVYNYHELVRRNKLARLLYEQTLNLYPSDPLAFQDLLESPEIHAQRTAYRAIELGSEQALEVGRQHLYLLLATLLRPLHRKTRLSAFGALAALSLNDQASAAVILERARQAWDLPERGYPKEELAALMGRILYRWPELRRPSEQPVVYREAG